MAGEGAGRSPLKQALAAVRQLKARIAELEASGPRQADGPIAVVGIGCRYPDGAEGPEGFWNRLLDEREALTRVPGDRWDVARWPELPERGGFLAQVDRFDAAFFGIAPREAEQIDPVQRLLLETTWHALEDAGLAPSSLPRTGVWVGLGLSDYGRRHFFGSDPRLLTPYSGTGSFLSVAAGRIAYALGLDGPALTVDTACSSSLVSTHLGIQSLRRGEVDVALTAGANLLLSPIPSAYFQVLQALAPDGRCKTFSADADGYGRGEGVGVLVLKRLEDAVRDGDAIRAVIRGSAVNQDGRTNGLTAPSGRAQREVIRAALHDAGLGPDDVRVIEAHGTGTPLGDPIEVDALVDVFGDATLWLSSVKTVFGHTETAAGVAGLIKAILALEHRTLPAHLNLGRPNPRLRLDERAILIPEAAIPWPEQAPPRIGVSGFGLSGTNAHVILEAAPEAPAPDEVEGPGLVVLSARSEAALRTLVDGTATRLDDDSWRGIEAESVRREPLPLRIAAASKDPDGLAEALRKAPTVRATGGRSVWMFTGQGSQWSGMGRALLAEDAVFREVVERVFDVVPGLREVFDADDERLNDTRWTQPALFALQAGLAASLARYGMAPDTLVGHSVGAFAAAYLAGVFSLEDGARLVAARGRLMSELPPGGAMLVVFAPPSRVELPEGAELAALNHPNQAVFSGPGEAIDALEQRCAETDVDTRRLVVSHAFHSALMEPMLEDFRREVEAVELQSPTVPWISSVDGEPVGERATDPDYWVQQLRRPVRFVEATRALTDHAFFVELGPHPALCPAVARTHPDARLIPTLRRGHGGPVALLEAVVNAWSNGAVVELRPGRGRRPRAGLPPMPFERARHWIDPVDQETSRRPFEQVHWVASPAPSGRPRGRWWVVGDGDALASALEQAGCTVERVDADALPSGPDPEGIVLVEPRRQPLRLGATTRAAFALLRQTDAPIHAVVRSDRPTGMPGLMRVLRRERPDRAGALVWDPATLDAVLPELAARTAEVRLTPQRQVPELVELPEHPAPPLPGTVWITGASGDLGLVLARQLAPRVERLVLLSRSSIPDATLVRLGPNVHSVQGDVTDNLVPLAAEEPPGLIVHLAGVLEDGPVTEVLPETLERVCKPKIDGAWRLHEVAPEAEMVLLGSAAAQLGNPGQAAYAVANSWLAGFARWRTAQGAPTWCLALGPVSGTAMVRGLEQHLLGSGQLLLSPAEAIEQILAIRGLPEPVAVAAPRRVDAQRDEPEATTSVPEAVDAALEAVLGRVPADAQGFFDAGLDSLMAQELRQRLESSLRRELPASLVFDAPTRSALIAALGGGPVRVRSVGAGPTDAVAIVGMAVRFPGAPDLDAFWELLRSGGDAVRRIDRWSLELFRSPTPAPGKHVTTQAGLLDDVAGFDHERFGISPREASRIDPQQRLVLEASLGALEHAGIHTDQVGVFVGIGRSTYGARFDPLDTETVDPYAGTGNESAFAPGRVSHALGLTGPALAIDTACSSSLVAVHLAARALRAGECEVALAGGVHVLTGPETTIQLSQIGALSPTGRCHTFSDQADGYVRGEGVGMIVLKPLSRALEDGDTIWAVLQGSAVNHDGRSAGVTVPNGTAQRAVIQAALDDAGIAPSQVDALEAHGTGTRLGDPIEVGAVRDVLLAGRDPGHPLALGSVKTNIGHLEAAAGVAGLVKATLMLHHQQLPAHLHCERPNPELDLTGIVVPDRILPWSARHVGVSSFGIAGTNAHVILGRGAELPVPVVEPRPRVLQVLSGPTGALSAYPDIDAPRALALTRRRHGPVRAWSVGRGVSSPASPVDGRVAWLFTGQGSQRPGMADPLLVEPVFAEVWNRGITLLEERGFDVAAFDDDRVHRTENAQPALFLFGIALAAWLESRGLRPDLVMGHSLGELTAAAYAGLWSFEDALELVCVRGTVMGSLPSGGASAAVFTDEATVRAAIGGREVDVAGLNGPTETVISGDAEAVRQVLDQLDVPSRPLQVSHPFHSRFMEPAVAPFEAAVASRTTHPLKVPLISNADGLPVGVRAHDPTYWAGLIREPVRFARGVDTLDGEGARIYLEVGARSVLTGMVRRLLPEARAISTQQRDIDPLDAMYGAVGELWVAGVEPDWPAMLGTTVALPAPPSPRNHTRHWVDADHQATVEPRWFYRVTRIPGDIEHQPEGTLYAGDLAGALASAQEAVRRGERWAPADDDPALQAFARSFALEFPDCWGGPADDRRRLERSAPLEPIPLRPDMHVLVTGGTGTLGRAIVAALQGQGRTIHVLSRGGHPVEGAISYAVDVGDAGALRAWLEAHPVQGIVHCAGVGRRVDLLDETPSGLAEVLRPKQGAQTLDIDGLDFFVVVSSIAAIWGSAGQTSYAAANGLLERVVAARRDRGEPARLVALGPVRGGLLDDEGEAWLARRGLRALAPAQAAQAVLRGDGVVADVDWERFLPIQTARLVQPLFDALTSGSTPIRAGGRSATLRQVQAEAARILGLAPSDLPVDRGLFDAGMDSVTAVELATALSTPERALSPALVFEHGTVEAIARWLEGASGTETTVQAAVDEPIVIVGMACRLPGGVDSPETYWELLIEGRDAVGPIPASRWDAEAIYDPEPGTPGRTYVRDGAFIDDVDRFDPLFFGIAPREAASLDPQQRLLLEVAWEALERGGPTRDLAGQRIGVFVGLPESSYLQRFRAAGQPLYPDAYAGTGNESSFAAGRIAHALGTRGPAVSLNTACSSSLVTIHLAAEALRAGDCDAALAGGASLMLSPDNHIYLAQLQALAPDGRCKTFSARADGYGRGEGAGMVLLMRESDARAQGRPILARLLGSAVNHDGASSGLTVPNGTAQEQVIRDAVARAGIAPEAIGYVEAHGTGTRLGDPIEIRALRRALGDAPRFVGSVKTQIGHLEQAAGAAAVIKCVLQLRHARLAPHLHLDSINPDLDLGPLQIPTEPVEQPLQAVGVSGFGLSGTNAHLILGPGEPPAEVRRTPGPWCTSASSPRALEAYEAALQPAISSFGGAIGPTLWQRRPRRYRRVSGGPIREAHRAPKLVLLFTGQGAQRPGMDELLYRQEPVYRDAFDEVQRLFGLPLREVMADERVHDTRYTQPVLFAMEWALATWWRALGVEADLVAGHSIGELTAAAWAGMIRLPDAVQLVLARAEAMAEQRDGGAMAAVFADEDTVRAMLAEGAEIAGVNGPAETVISGDSDAVARALAALDADHRELTVSHAFHSAHLEGAVEPVTRAAASLPWFGPRIPVVRNVDGELHDGAPPASYWGEQLRSAVRFWDGLHTLIDEGATCFLEVGPHPVLAGLARQASPDAVTVGSVVKGEPRLVDAAGALWTHGIDVPMDRWMRDAPHLVLPTTPYASERCWLDLPELTEVGSSIGRSALRIDWEPVAGGVPFVGRTIVIEPGPIASIWEQLCTASAEAASDREPVRFVTRGAALEGAGDPLICAVHGFVRAARRELGLDWRLVDVDGAVPASLPDDPWLRVRGGRVQAARLVYAPQAPLDIGGTVLITGGFGGLGVAIAEALRGRAEVVLLSRTVRSEVLERLGGEAAGIRGVAADVTDPKSLKQALQGEEPDLVLHAAGVLRDGAIGQAWESVQPVFDVKVEGARNLRSVLGDVPMVLFSSASATMGAAGQTAYAAANAVLEGLARSWRSEGMQVTSIGWGPWSEVGMAASLPEAVKAQQRRQGVRWIQPEQGIEALLKHGGGDPLVVLPMDWPRFLPEHGEPLLTPLGWAPTRTVKPAPGWHADQGLDGMSTWLEGVAREVLALPAERDLPEDRPLQDFGLDSLMAVTLRNRLVDAGVDVPIARLIGGPSIEEIVAIARARSAPVQAVPEAVEDQAIDWFHPLVTHALLAVLALLAGALIGASLMGVQAPEAPSDQVGERVPRADR